MKPVTNNVYEELPMDSDETASTQKSILRQPSKAKSVAQASDGVVGIVTLKEG